MRDSLSKFTDARAGIISTGTLDTARLYRQYEDFCGRGNRFAVLSDVKGNRSKSRLPATFWKVKPMSYETFFRTGQGIILGLRDWWMSVRPGIYVLNPEIETTASVQHFLDMATASRIDAESA